MRESMIELLVGTLVLIGAAAFLVFAVNTGGSGSTTGGGESYDLMARFNQVNGVNRGSDVRLSGIKIGVVSAVGLDPETYLARMTLTLNEGIDVPVDTIAKVSSDSLLGGSHIALVPGSETDMLTAGDEIEFTRGSVDLLTLLGSVMSGSAGGQ